MADTSTGVSGAFAPLRHRSFAVLWAATVIGNIGIWMRDVGLVWLMTEQDQRAWLVAIVQAAASLPIFLLALPAGALADLVDRRRLLFACQFVLMMLSISLALLTWAGLMTPALIIVLTLAAGVGTAFSSPAWQTIVPLLVPREDLRPAVALNSLGINISRAIGPALGGAVVASAGVAAAFVVDALTFVLILAALVWWRPPARAANAAPPEAIRGAMKAGLRYARNSPALRRVLLRALGFFLCGAAPWALMPLVARQELDGEAALYGLMLGAIGIGAIAGALVLPWMRQRLGGSNGIMTAGAAGLSVATLLLGLVPLVPVALLACALLGAAWIAALTTLNVAAQSALPDWVRGRGLSLYLMVFSGGMAAGSLGWGLLADQLGVPVALALAALASLAVALVLRQHAPLPDADNDLMPSDHMPGHVLPADGPLPGDGPVVVMVEYRLRTPEARPALMTALARLEEVRRRDGAQDWRALADPADPLRVVEYFGTADWAEHERMHARATRADQPLHAAANAFDIDGQPRVSHLLPLQNGAL